MNNKLQLTALISAALLILFAAAMSGRETVGHAQRDAEYKKPILETDEWFADAKRQLHLANNTVLLASAKDEITGDDILDAILLVGLKSDGSDSAENIDVIVRDGKTGRFTSAGLRYFSSAQAGLFVGDFNADKVNDVLVTAPIQQGGSFHHAIVSFASGQPNILFSGKDSAYQFLPKQMKSQYADVAYPQVDGLTDQTARDFVNKTLEAAASELLNRATQEHPMTIEYSVARSDAALLSVIFTDGRQNAASKIIHSVTINMKTRKVLTAESLAPSNRQSRQGINSLIQSAAKAAGMESVPELSELTGIFLTDQEVVLYQQPSESSAQKQISLPFDKARPFLNGLAGR